MGQATSSPIEIVKRKNEDEILALLVQHTGNEAHLAPAVAAERDNEEKTVLHWAASEGKSKVVELILSLKAIPVDSVDIYRNTALHSAVFKNHFDVAKQLIFAGASLDAQDDSGMTALHWAVLNCSKECFDILLEAGANVKIKNFKGQTVFNVAESLKKKSWKNHFLGILKSHFGDSFDSLDTPVHPKPTSEISSHSTLNKETLNTKTVSESFSQSKHENQSILSSHTLQNIEYQKEQAYKALLNGMGKEKRRMLALCQIWGLIKYSHPFLSYRPNLNWDDAFLEVLPSVSDPDASNTQFLEAVATMISKLGDANSRLLCGDQPVTLESLKSDALVEQEDSISKLNSSPRVGTNEAQTNDFLKSEKINQTQPKVEFNNEKIALISCTDYLQFNSTEKLSEFMNAFHLAHQNASAVVFDLRNLYRDHSPQYSSSQQIEQAYSLARCAKNLGLMFQEAFKVFLREPLVLPAMRQRMYQGLPEHFKHNPSSQSAFNHGFLMNESTVLYPIQQNQIKQPLPPRMMSFIMDKTTPNDIIDIAVALQSKRMASIVFQVEKIDSTFQASHNGPIQVYEPGILSTTFNISSIIDASGLNTKEVVVSIRQNERINLDSTVGFHPDYILVVENGSLGLSHPRYLLVFPALKGINGTNPDFSNLRSKFKNNSKNDPCIEYAMQFCTGEIPHVPRTVRHAIFPIKMVENEYTTVEEGESQICVPEQNLRFLSLFRLWNAVKFFYPYKNLMEYPWEIAFLKSYHEFANAEEITQYSLAIAQMMSMLCDTHAYVKSPHLGRFVGTHVPAIVVKNVNGMAVVTHVSAIETKTSNQSEQSSDHHDHSHSSSDHSHSSPDHHDQSKLIVVHHHDHHDHLVHPIPSSLSNPSDSNLYDSSHPLPQLSVQVGDIITSVDGISIENRRKMLASIFSASTIQASKWRTDLKLLAGNEGTMAKLNIKRQVSRVLSQNNSEKKSPSFIEFSTEIPRGIASHIQVAKTGPISSVLEILDSSGMNVGYLDLTRLALGEADVLFDSLISNEKVGSIILDIRGYTRGSMSRIAPKLANHSTNVAITEIPVYLPSAISSDHHEPLIQRSFQKCAPSSSAPHTSRASLISFVALINEETISHGEYAVSLLKQIRPDIVVVGSTSNGTVGNVTNLPLPGGILVGFTGMGIARANGAQIQRNGVQPDIHAKETLESIITGTDEIMEKALEYLKTKPPNVAFLKK